jgi:hypothetical protein
MIHRYTRREVFGLVRVFPGRQQRRCRFFVTIRYVLFTLTVEFDAQHCVMTLRDSATHSGVVS